MAVKLSTSFIAGLVERAAKEYLQITNVIRLSDNAFDFYHNISPDGPPEVLLAFRLNIKNAVTSHSLDITGCNVDPNILLKIAEVYDTVNHKYVDLIEVHQALC